MKNISEKLQDARKTFDPPKIELHISNVHAREDGQGPSRFANGHARSASEARQIQDAEAFELQGLISEEEDEGEASNAHTPRTGTKRKAEDVDEEDSPRGKEETTHA